MNKLKCLFLSGLMAVMPVCMSGQQTPGEKSSKPRVIITCDPELDDLNSLIRFLLFQYGFPCGRLDLCQQSVPLER